MILFVPPFIKWSSELYCIRPFFSSNTQGNSVRISVAHKRVDDDFLAEALLLQQSTCSELEEVV